jgi:phage/plasmid-associated DNA primase
MAVSDNGGTEKSSSTLEFLKVLFGDTAQQIFLQTLANDGDDPDEGPNKRHLMSRDIGAIERFVLKHDRARRGMFVCVATIADGAGTRSKDNCRELVCIHQDLDFKGIAETEPAIWGAIERLEAQPSIVVRSGGGLHLYWLLREPLDAQEHRDAVDLLLRQLAEIVAGDLATCEIARLMRLPGTFNSKYGDMREVTIERCDPALRYELEGLAEWVSYQRPVLRRKPPETPKAAGKKSRAALGGVPENPFLAAAAAMGRQPRLDVEEALAAMGQGNIHDTQVRVSAALLARGEALEDVVSILMEATRQAIGADAARWNWRAEEKRIRVACNGAIRKFPKVEQVEQTTPEPEQTDNVADLDAARAKRKAPPKPRRGKINHLDIGAILLEGWRSSGQGLVFTETQGAWRYFDGLWRLQDDRTLRAWLDPQIEQCIRGTEAKSRNSLVNETRSWIARHPDLQVDEAPFDRHGKVPTRSGLVDPVTGRLEPPHASQWCTWRIEAEYDPDATCPWWLEMLEDLLADRPDDVRAEYIGLIQEMLGAGLIDAKPRALSKALVTQGGSNAGKSGLLEVLAGLFGPDQNTSPLDSLEGAHGMVPFARRVPWVLHEAFDQRKWHFSSTVKALITGEPVQINVKNGPILSKRFTAPVFWGANNPPQFQEASKAIVSRLVVVKCRQEFDESEPVGAAAEALRLGLGRPSTLVLERELPGLLAWAIAGLRRALLRGSFRQPAEALDVAHEIRRDSNLVAGFFEDFVEFDPNTRVTTSDFCAAFAVWWQEHKGESRGTPSNESIGRAVAALGDGRIAINRKELRSNAKRYYGGIKLSADGLRLWETAIASDFFKGKTTSTSNKVDEVNSDIPAQWYLLPSVEAMQKEHASRARKRDR